MRIVLASGNPGKLQEFSEALAPAGIHMLAQGSMGIPDASEPYLTFLENALAKARHASRHAGLPALADDSGLCVHALQGAPGVHSARYASLSAGNSSDAANNARLLQELAAITDRRACFVSVLVFLRHPEDPLPVVAEGLWHGEILPAPRGDNGFGYDPLFFVPELGLSAAELSLAEKGRHSHRARALQTMLQALQKQPGMNFPDVLEK